MPKTQKPVVKPALNPREIDTQDMRRLFQLLVAYIKRRGDEVDANDLSRVVNALAALSKSLESTERFNLELTQATRGEEINTKSEDVQRAQLFEEICEIFNIDKDASDDLNAHE